MCIICVRKNTNTYTRTGTSMNAGIRNNNSTRLGTTRVRIQTGTLPEPKNRHSEVRKVWVQGHPKYPHLPKAEKKKGVGTWGGGTTYIIYIYIYTRTHTHMHTYIA